MKKTFNRSTFAVLALSLVLTACSNQPKHTPAKPSDPPTSRQATTVESYSANETLIRAIGLGHDTTEARLDARKAAIWHSLFGGTNALLSTADQRQAFAAVEAEFYANAMNYIALEGEIVSSQVEAGQQRIERIFRVNVARLKDDLVAKNILQDTRDLAANLANPTIAVIAKNPAGNDRHAAGVFSEYLQDRGFEVTVLAANERINDIVLKAAALSGNIDPSFLLALQTGSDIYITLDAEVAERTVARNRVAQATVNATAYYTATGTQLGASTGYSPERAISGSGALTAEAANDTADKVLGQIQRSWQREAQQGRSFKVVFSAAPELGDISREIHQLSNQVCEGARRNAAGSNSFDYTLTCQGKDTMQLLIALQDNYSGPGQIFRVMDAGAFLVVKVGHSQLDEILIQ
ncbi:DUF6175 family protein [Thiomicrospira microaerophila]|uniref:DUF6175 family protein n=1 Tax=Thiomicrospira microaerophila TaxID=406020 RepID=UPI0005CB3D97|nr:DUF6175 family protein [Thiomicrospira microaerophila]